MRLRLLVSSWMLVVALLLGSCATEVIESAPFIEGESPTARASAYLIANEAVLGTDAILPLEYMRRRFGAWWASGAIDRYAGEARMPENRALQYPFLRLIDPGARYEFNPNEPPGPFAGSPTAWNLVWALHCEDVELTPEFTSRLDEQTLSWDRGPALSARALGWALEQRCIDFPEAEASTLLEKRRMIEVAGASTTTDIAFVESVSMLLYRGHRDSVLPEWIERIIDAQLDDGSWDLGGSAASDRATSECLLALEQWEHPDAPPVPWVPPRG